MITVAQYFGPKFTHPDATPERVNNAVRLLDRVNALLDTARTLGVYKDWVDPDTGSQVSGAKGGSGDGGFRLSTSATGAPNSTHKQGQGVDVYDPLNRLDFWLTDDILEAHGLYREAPSATPTWVHMQAVPPRSGRRTYQP